MNYIKGAIIICLFLILQENIIWLILGGLFWSASLYLIYDSRQCSPWYNDIPSWAKHHHLIGDEPVLISIENEYIRISEELHDIDYRILTNTRFQRPKNLIFALFNKYWLSNKFTELSKKKDKLKEEYMMAEKLISVDNILRENTDNTSIKARPFKWGKGNGYTTLPASAGKYTLF